MHSSPEKEDKNVYRCLSGMVYQDVKSTDKGPPVFQKYGSTRKDKGPPVNYTSPVFLKYGSTRIFTGRPVCKNHVNASKPVKYGSTLNIRVDPQKYGSTRIIRMDP